MLISKEQAEKRLSSPDNMLNIVERVNSHFEIRKLHAGGRTPGENLTPEDRLIAGTLARVNNQSAVAKEFGISRAHTNSLAAGRTGYKGMNRPSTGLETSGILEEVKEVALNRVLASMGLISDDKLKVCGAKDLSMIASNMSKVVNNVSPKEVNETKVQVVLYAPRTKEVSEFEIVEV